MSNAEAKEIIEKIGIKRQVAAMKSMIHPTTFSGWLNNTKDLTPEQLQRVTKYLEHMKGAVLESD